MAILGVKPVVATPVEPTEEDPGELQSGAVGDRGFHTSGAPLVRSHLAAGPGQESRSALVATPLA